MISAPARRLPVVTDVLWRGRGIGRATALAVGGSLALALSAKVQVAFWPVPMTMQSLTVLMIGIAYGSRLGALTVLAYLAEGVAGMPVFAGPLAGPAVLLGPTGGFLLGFVLAASLVGWLAERGWDRSITWASVALVAGHALLFVPGVAWLAVLFGWPKAVAAGLTPFILASLVKTGLGVALVAAFWSAAGRPAAPEA